MGQKLFYQLPEQNKIVIVKQFNGRCRNVPKNKKTMICFWFCLTFCVKVVCNSHKYNSFQYLL